MLSGRRSRQRETDGQTKIAANTMPFDHGAVLSDELLREPDYFARTNKKTDDHSFHEGYF